MRINEGLNNFFNQNSELHSKIQETFVKLRGVSKTLELKGEKMICSFQPPYLLAN